MTSQLLIAHDEIDLQPGTVRLKLGGGHGGHNGLRDVIQYCGAEFMRLHHLDLASGSLDVLTGNLSWDVEDFEISPNGEFLAYEVNTGGFSTLEVLHLPERSLVALPELPPGIIGRALFSHDSQQLGLTINRAIAPSDVYSIDLTTRSLTRWTESDVGGLDTAANRVKTKPCQ